MNITEKLLAFAAATNNKLFDPAPGWSEDGDWMVEAAETHETLEDFIESSKNWRERTAAKHGEIAGMKYIAWSQVQALKGQPRRALSVIDFGEVRFAIDADLTNFAP